MSMAIPFDQYKNNLFQYTNLTVGTWHAASLRFNDSTLQQQFQISEIEQAAMRGLVGGVAIVNYA